MSIPSIKLAEYEMGVKGLISRVTKYILTGWIILFSGVSVAQRSSAEKMAEMGPTSLSTGQELRDGIRNVTYRNNLLYVVNVWAGIRIVDVSDVRNPKELSRFETEHRPHNIALDDNLVYVSDELGGVQIFDITDRTRPKKTGTINTDGDAFWVVARHPYVFVAEEEKGVVIYDVTDAAQPVKKGSFDTPGWAWGLALKDNLLYVADKSGGLQILDISDVENPRRVGQYTKLKYAKTVQIDDNHAYIASGPEGLAILDISNPAFPVLVSTYPTDGFIFSAFKSGKNVYLANESNQKIEIINVNNITGPVKEGEYVAEGKVYGVWKHDVYLYVAADTKLLLLRHNNPPQLAAIGDRTVDEQQLLTITPQASDPDGDAFLFKVQNLPQGATCDSSTGVINWVPTYEQSGNYDGITLSVIEQTASKLSVADTFSIIVNHVNRAPTIPDVADQQVDENTLLSFVIAEGADEDKEDIGKLVYRAENLPEGATFDPLTRTFSWTPGFEQSGVYVIDFIVSDPPGAVARDACTITVNHVDRPPSLVAVENKSINENEELLFTIEGSDPDAEDRNAIAFAAFNLPDGANFDSESRTFSWTPRYDQSGEYRGLMFVMTAGKLSDSITVDITVNHVNRSPVLAAVPDQSTDEEKPLHFVLEPSDPDAEDAGKLVVTAANLPPGAVFNSDSLMFDWTPTFEQSGEYSDISFTVKDPAGLSDTKTVRIVVNHVNRAPVMNEIAARVVDENKLLTFEVSGSDPDVEDQNSLKFTLEKIPEGATFDGKIFSWTPTYDQSGIYELKFTLSDGNLSDSKTTTVTVHHVNRPPVLEPVVAQTVDENKTLTFTLKFSDPDVEDKGKLAVSAAGLPEGAIFDSTNATFNWTPTFEQSGSYTLKFTCRDPQGLVSEQEVAVTVNHVNRTPVFAEPAAQTTEENETLVYVVPAGTDPDAEDVDNIVYSASDLPQGATFDALTRTLTWTPGFDQSGEYTVNISCSDGEFTVTQPLKITVNHVNRPPEIEPVATQTVKENALLEFTVKGSDPDREDEGKWKLSAANLPQGARFDVATGKFNWTPTFEQSGEYTITITNTDPAGLAVSIDVPIKVEHVNRTPVFNPLAAQVVDENTPLTFIIPEGSDPDAEDAGKLTYSTGTLDKGAGFDPATRTFSWTPGYDQSGEYEYAITCSDGEFTVTRLLRVTVNNVNRPPVLEPIAPQTADENTPFSLKLQYSDPDKEDEGKLQLTATNLPEGARLDESNGSINWTPTFEQAGTYENISVKVSDAEGLTSEQTFSITVNNVNRAPQLQDPGALNAQENQPFSYQFSATDPDAEDSENLSISAAGLPAGAVFDTQTATLQWTPNFTQAGEHSFEISVTDAGGLSDTKTVSILVANSNRLPVLAPVEAQTVAENRALNLRLQTSDEDADDVLTYSADGLPAGAEFDESSGVFSWRPGYDQAGEYSITFSAKDGHDEVSQTVKITVTNVNRAPEFEGSPSVSVQVGEQVELRFSASDEDGDDLTYTAGGLPAGAEFDSASGTLTWTPTAEQTGNFSITVTVSDGSDSDSTTGTITVTAPPPPPPK